MLMTTSGSGYWPRTAEGRVLCFLLALYAFAIFGYVTATLATLLIGQQIQRRPPPNKSQSLDALRDELSDLNSRLAALAQKLPPHGQALAADENPNSSMTLR
jgi:voltage-gated potassium channel